MNHRTKNVFLVYMIKRRVTVRNTNFIYQDRKIPAQSFSNTNGYGAQPYEALCVSSLQVVHRACPRILQVSSTYPCSVNNTSDPLSIIPLHSFPQCIFLTIRKCLSYLNIY